MNVTDDEKQEVEEYLPTTIDWLDRNAVQRYVRDTSGLVVVDRAWEMAALLRLTAIRERLRLTAPKD